MSIEKVKSPETLEAIQALITSCGADPTQFQAGLVAEMVQTSLKLLFEDYDQGQIKLINRALKELRYAYNIFNQYPGIKRLSIFGSTRTPESHPDYQMAKTLASALAPWNWMIITGAADGIMKAGHEGTSPESSFGLAIRLPSEDKPNEIIIGNPRLIHFRYFFTRKLMFLAHSHAIAVFPGGVGTQDELFECLTLMQTGKASIVPIVMLEGAGGHYWREWDQYVSGHLLARGLISPEDKNFYTICKSVEEAVAHLNRFYHRFHSYRYLQNQIIIRMQTPLSEEQIDALNTEFPSLVTRGKIEQRSAFPEEGEYEELPRLTFCHTRRNYGTLRSLFDRINEMEEKGQ